jgi:serine/threonine-protein kinase RsbW
MPTKTFPGLFGSLAAISKFVTGQARQAGLNDDAVYHVELAVDEASSNIIEHAYGGENKGEITCVCDIEADGLTITLRDHGQAFDPTLVPAPDLTSNPEARKKGGLGLFIIHKVMDEVDFHFSEEGNQIIMVKYKA